MMNLELKRMRSIRPFVSVETCKRLVSSLVFSKLDYCNSLLCGVTKKNLRRLQVVQNSLARLTLKKPKIEHVTPMLKELHWLPVEERILYKTSAIIFKTLSNSAPDYLFELLEFYNPPRKLRSSADKTRLKKPKVRTQSGARSFNCFGPSAWNILPVELRECSKIEIFKKHLKTHLFPKF